VSVLLAQTREMARRSVLQTLRQPAMIVPPIVFPLFLLAVNVGGLDAATEIPGFPTDSYLDFAIAFAFMQGSLFAMINAGTHLARDVQDGFLKRLALTPMQRAALLIGNLAGVLVVALFSIALYMAVGLAAGMEIKAGVGGALVLVVLALLVSVALASVGALVGLRFGDPQAVQGFFPLFFVLFFLSSTNMPRNLIETDWFRTVATYNPVSYLVEGVRSLIITGWDGEALALGFGFGILLSGLGIFGATRALRTRLVRT
jgi:ABC-2 type transport system permease protein